jgi:hypothetical protein
LAPFDYCEIAGLTAAAKFFGDYRQRGIDQVAYRPNSVSHAKRHGGRRAARFDLLVAGQENAACKAYLGQNGRLLRGQIPGLMIGGRCGCNHGGPTGLVEAVRFELTGPCEGFGSPKVRPGVSRVR